MLVDRVSEVAELDRMLAAVRDGLCGALVLRGQSGIGKTALLDYAAAQLPSMQVTRVTGLESEMDLGFAALHQLLIPFLDGLDRLPGPQREALGSAFGLLPGLPPDRFLVGLATLTLITEASAERPVLCLIDDAQWLDRVSIEVLGFVARRLLADRVGMLFAVRDGEQQRTSSLEGLPMLSVGALPTDAAGELLARAVSEPVDPRVGERIVTETAGNPLALLEFAGELTPQELSGVAPLSDPLRFAGQLEELYRARIRALPDKAQLLLLIAAADQLSDPDKVFRAAALAGVDPDLAELPSLERLVTWTPTVRFRHPLMRSAAYYAAPLSARRRAHEALAGVSDPVRDPDRRAWHLAAAAAGPDEQVAVELERSAERARRRGGWASGAAFLERAAELTPDPARRARRLLEAAEAKYTAGEAPAARLLLEHAAPDLDDPLARAQARRLEGLTLYASGPLPEATTVLLDAARRIEPHNPSLARDTLLDAFAAAQWSGPSGPAVADVVHAIRQAPKPAETPPATTSLLLDGFAAVAERRYAEGFELLRRAAAPLTTDQPLPDDLLPRFTVVLLAVSLLLDWPARQALERRWAEDLRRRGALAPMLAALVFQAYNQLLEGRFADAEATLAEGRALSEATAFRAHLSLFAAVELAVLAWRGREAEARALAARLLADFAAQGDGLGMINVRMALTWLEIGLGNYREALPGAQETYRSQTMAVLEVVEAATRCGDSGTAAAALAGFVPQAEASGTGIALGVLALGQALLAADEAAEPAYQQALEHLRGCPLVPHLARAHLLYGEWLRRQRRRRDARDQLRTAWQLFDGLGMQAFAERAGTELRATGEHARQRRPAAGDPLTPQETQIARLAAEGLSNPEIAARLFISAGTVDYHLNKVYRKLGINSRVRLAHVLKGADGHP